MTREEIIEWQRREREFRGTEIGALFNRFENLTATAWIEDTEGHLKSAEKAFEKQKETREELIALLRPLAGL